MAKWQVTWQGTVISACQVVGEACKLTLFSFPSRSFSGFNLSPLGILGVI